mmetsp:Transcript_24689/g.97971  ORF Transcript_24689/g.97971 Transcript_24689/m.97971 type:complete len:212 (-) Transcript_24689:90-725(-)
MTGCEGGGLEAVDEDGGRGGLPPAVLVDPGRCDAGRRRAPPLDDDEVGFPAASLGTRKSFEAKKNLYTARSTRSPKPSTRRPRCFASRASKTWTSRGASPARRSAGGAKASPKALRVGRRSADACGSATRLHSPSRRLTKAGLVVCGFFCASLREEDGATGVHETVEQSGASLSAWSRAPPASCLTSLKPSGACSMPTNAATNAVSASASS